MSRNQRLKIVRYSYFLFGHENVAFYAAEFMTLKMLCVEDNRLNALLFESAIRLSTGIELRMAEDGNEALDMVSQWTPHVLVLDANLPDINGFELLRRLRLTRGLAEVPAFMCTADSSEETLRRAENAGFEGFWTKPIDLPCVLAIIDKLQAAHSDR